MSYEDDYKGPPFDAYPPEFRQKATEMAEKYGVEPMDIVRATYRSCMAAINLYVSIKKRVQEEERQKREHKRKNRKCRSRKRR